MTDATILLGPDERPSGSAFLWSPGVVITANHVLKDRPVDPVRVRIGNPRGGAGPTAAWPVTTVDRDKNLDVAMLTVDATQRAPLFAADAVVDERWVVTSRPAVNDPQLAGRVAATDWFIVNDGGAEVAVLQLDVEQWLGDFGGYSGSAVRLHSRRNTVLGVLCEQVHSRIRPADGGRAPASTVLYAVPIGKVAGRFALPVTDDVAHRHFTSVRARLRAGDPDGADRALARIPSTVRDAEYWLWRARAARARDNRLAEAEYLDRALRCDSQHPPSVAAKITQLLLTNEPGDRAAAQRLAENARNSSPELDAWTACLLRSRLLAPGIRSQTELSKLCPYPDPEWS
jgi:hypothetical protein